MFDMMLGPLGTSYWVGPSAMPQVRFHHDWSRVAFPIAAANAQPLDAFSYGIGSQQPAAITAAIGANAANIFDTSISKPDALSKDCLATHFGVQFMNVNDVVAVDTVETLANFRTIALHNTLIQLFYGERTNEETSGFLEDFPAGMGTWYQDATVVIQGIESGSPLYTNVKPLPQPLACKGGDTYFRVTFTPRTRSATISTVITTFMAHVYGVSPARRPPVEAHTNAMQALSMPR
jgi:hypothetical protein